MERPVSKGTEGKLVTSLRHRAQACVLHALNGCVQQGLTSAFSYDYGRRSILHHFELRNQAAQHMDRCVSHLTVSPATRLHCELISLTFCECDGHQD